MQVVFFAAYVLAFQLKEQHIEDSPYCHLSQSASHTFKVLKVKMEQSVNEHQLEKKTEYTFPESEESSLKLQRIEGKVSVKSPFAAQ